MRKLDALQCLSITLRENAIHSSHCHVNAATSKLPNLQDAAEVTIGLHTHTRKHTSAHTHARAQATKALSSLQQMRGCHCWQDGSGLHISLRERASYDTTLNSDGVTVPEYVLELPQKLSSEQIPKQKTKINMPTIPLHQKKMTRRMIARKNFELTRIGERFVSLPPL